MKILVFTTDIPPLPGLPTSGTALRTFGLAEGLRCHGHEVQLCAPSAALAGMRAKNDTAALPAEVREELRTLEAFSFDTETQPQRIAEVRPDLIICGHWPAFAARVRPRQPVVVDLAGPHILERHYQRAPDQHGAVLAKLSVLASADYFIVSGPSQRDYFFSYMQRAGVTDPGRRTATISMPLSPQLPSKPRFEPEAFPRFIFGGVFLPWQNPAAGLRKLAQELEHRRKGSLTLIGGKHPNYDVDGGGYAKLFAELARNKRVTKKPMLPFDRFSSELSSADVALDLMEWNLERQLAMTIRSTTYLWAGLPVIYNNYADLGRLIESYDAGWLVDPADEHALAEVIASIYSDPDGVREKSANAQRLAAEEFAWDRAVQPLLELLDPPAPPPSSRYDIVIDSPELADFQLSQGRSMQQYFVCRRPGLSSISIRLATHGRRRCGALRVRLSLISAAGWGRALPDADAARRAVFEREIAGEEIVDSEWHSIDFDALWDSDGRVFVLELEAAPGTTDGDGAFPWVSRSGPYPLTGLKYAGQRLGELGLCLRTTCAPISHRAT